MNQKIVSKLEYLYGKEDAAKIAVDLQKFINTAKKKIKAKKRVLWDQKDIALITYPVSFNEENTPTLITLNKFLNTFIKDKFSIVHILPFYPYSADRGFSVIDYFKVKKEFGEWKDIKKIASKYRLMIDLVGNHVSIQNIWFKRFLEGDKKYKDYFIWFTKDNLPAGELINKVTRGRTTPLLTQFKTKDGIRYLWTTYSINNLIDQVDLNYHNPIVLLEIVKVFLFYLKQGASILRFDGAGGLWKELGTTCKHLPQNHKIISLFRDILKELNQNTLIFTETTTASFEDNISYAGKDEAHAVYNFSLGPLVLLAFYLGDARKLSDYSKMINPKTGNTFFNILDTHDGINMYSVSKIINGHDLKIIFNQIKNNGGNFAYRSTPDGGRAVKEMNISWWSALNGDGEGVFNIQLNKFITSRAIAMSLKGIPAVYYLSLFGAKSDHKTFSKTKHGRDLNRTDFNFKELQSKLTKAESRERIILNNLLDLVNLRKSFKAFHPDSKQEVLSLDERVFAILRGVGKNRVIALHNVSGDVVNVKYEDVDYRLEPYSFIWQKV